MKILWLCNVIPPVIAKQLNTETTVKEGWIDASLRRLLKDEGQDISIGIACPDTAIDQPLKKDRLLIEGKQVSLYRFMEHTASPWVYDKTLSLMNLLPISYTYSVLNTRIRLRLYEHARIKRRY